MTAPPAPSERFGAGRERAPAATPAGAPRPDVLALPSATTVRMLVLAVALVVSALFAGTALHNALLGQSWTDAVRACGSPTELLPLDAACVAPAEGRRAVVSLATAALVLLLAVLVAAAVPASKVRALGLRPADGRFDDAVRRVADLAFAERVRRPGLLVGKRVRSPFCIGRPGSYRIVMPLKLVLLPQSPVFAALVRHELAHLVHRDVPLSWLGRTAGYVLFPLLALPVLAALLQGEPALAFDVAWRAAVLALVVAVVAREMMRAREYDADVRATRTPGVAATLDRALAEPPTPWWRVVWGWHPDHPHRRAVIADPARAARLGWVDGVTIAFLVALALPILTNIASAALLGAPVSGLPALIGALVAGPLFGAAIGLGTWRQALVARTTWRPPSVLPVALGVLGGGVAGQVVSLAGTGLEGPGGFGAAWLLLLVPVALTGATVLVGGLGERWVRATRRTPTAVLVPAVLTGAVVTVPLLWVFQQLQLLFDDASWAVTAAWLTAPGALVLPGAAAFALAVVAAVPVRDGPVPGWLRAPGVTFRRARRTVLTGLVAGLCAGAAGTVYRLARGPLTDDVDRIRAVDAIVLGSGATAAAVVLVLGLLFGAEGAARGLVAGPVAALTAGTVFLVGVLVAGGNPLPFGAHVLAGAVTLGFVLSGPAALAALAAPARGVAAGGAAAARSGPVALSVLLAALLAAAVGVGALAGRAVLVPGLASDLGPAPRAGQVIPGGTPTPGAGLTPGLYRSTVAAEAADRRLAIGAAVQRVVGTSTSDRAAATAIRADVLPPLRDLKTGADGVAPDDPTVAAVHARLRAAVDADLAGYTLLAEALDTGDPSRAERAQVLLDRGSVEEEAWLRAVATM